MTIRFTLNGRLTEINCEPDLRVIDLLREDLGLTGTKEACGSGECGACSILVDGESRLSCLMLAKQLEGRHILTIEGLAEGDTLHPVQEAFVSKGAVQCGFCSPGMVIAAIDLLKRNFTPDRKQIREAISGNLCRCTGYENIVDAIGYVAEKIHHENIVGLDKQTALPACELSGQTRVKLPYPVADKKSTAISGQSSVLLPENLNELRKAMENFPEYRIFGGGTDVLVWRRENRKLYPGFIGLERISDLKRIETVDQDIAIGAMVTHQEILDNPLLNKLFPVLTQAVARLGSPPIRHMATIGGNICSASPAGDTLPPLYVSEAEVDLYGISGERSMPVSEFIRGPGLTCLRQKEILKRIRIPLPEKESRGYFFKVGERKALAIAVASMAALLSLSPEQEIIRAGFAWGSVGPTVMRFPQLDDSLKGRKLSAELLKEYGREASLLVSPISDIRAQEAHRRTLVANLPLKLLR